MGVFFPSRTLRVGSWPQEHIHITYTVWNQTALCDRWLDLWINYTGLLVAPRASMQPWEVLTELWETQIIPVPFLSQFFLLSAARCPLPSDHTHGFSWLPTTGDCEMWFVKCTHVNFCVCFPPSSNIPTIISYCVATYPHPYITQYVHHLIMLRLGRSSSRKLTEESKQMLKVIYSLQFFLLLPLLYHEIINSVWNNPS